MKKIGLLFGLLLTFSVAMNGQLDKIKYGQGIFQNEAGVYAYGKTAEDKAIICRLDSNLNYISEYVFNEIEDPYFLGEEVNSIMTFLDCGEYFLLKFQSKPNYPNIKYGKLKKDLSSCEFMKEVNFKDALKKYKSIVKENEGAILFDHLKIYPNVNVDGDIYMVLYDNAVSMVNMAQWRVNSGLPGKNYSHKGNCKLVKCVLDLDEETGMVWLKKEWEKDLGIQASQEIGISESTDKNLLLTLIPEDRSQAKIVHYSILEDKIQDVELNWEKEFNEPTISLVLGGHYVGVAFGDINKEGAKCGIYFLDKDYSLIGNPKVFSSTLGDAKIKGDCRVMFGSVRLNDVSYLSSRYFSVKQSYADANSNGSISFEDLGIVNIIVNGDEVSFNDIAQSEINDNNRFVDYKNLQLGLDQFLVNNGKFFYCNHNKSDEYYEFYNFENGSTLSGASEIEVISFDDLIDGAYFNYVQSFDGNKVLWFNSPKKNSKSKNADIFISEIKE